MAEAVPTALVGGSFDPVHLGHLHLVHTVASSTSYRRFIFVPVARNNFKRDANLASAEHRMRMLNLGFAAYPRLYPQDPDMEFIVDDCEVNRGGISYTYDTVKHLYLKYNIKGRLAVVMGDDLLGNLQQWHAYEDLKELVTFVVIKREGENTPFSDLAADLVYLENPCVEDSSTQIREGVRMLGAEDSLPKDIATLMPEEVAHYVESFRLYRT
ncbi:MAG: nicotinate (nicotinamide) nucleotide adenylyltransferase [Spirochaetaceae bacterium]|uniref:Probable nicotinate-nucleotide adenylyltransferase n=1 Tax=Sphaerochaeta halotolerans TaxID=2293840 RepID=A0A372MIQ4_9SPIR|nr:nicotinate (nicotinamide) nucleotide adenylyltransferase [Sphaerochaeta halotolerans]MBG0766723.1 nicotinate (nicotinamide) nucleotide adenylyltransferase [Spirochaetaceae bacterium]RFU95313.1 nicotinate (nicotinamide) nucleotide adenylyltransferase [Sphaerochaeta halotolerans]